MELVFKDNLRKYLHFLMPICKDVNDRNIAFAVLKSESGEVEILAAMSGEKHLAGMAPFSQESLLPVARNVRSPKSHSEYKILSELERRGFTGSVALFTEQKPCLSCEPAIDEFKRLTKGQVKFGKVEWLHKNADHRRNANLERGLEP